MIAGVHTFIELWQPDLWNERVVKLLDEGAVGGQLFTALGV